MTNTHDIKPTLVLGGTGTAGRHVLERLKAPGLPTRVGSRIALLSGRGEPEAERAVRDTGAAGLGGGESR